MLSKDWIEFIAKYSFIDKVERKGAEILIFYTVKGEQKSKRVLIRNSLQKLQDTIRDIRNEIGVSKYGKGYNSDYYIV